MTRTQNALRAGAATLLAGSLIFTSFQTFAQDFEWSDWGSVEEAPIELEVAAEDQTPTVSIISDTAMETLPTTDVSVWTETSTEAIEEIASDADASWEQESLAPSQDQPMGAITDGNASWAQESVGSTETWNPPIVGNACEALHTPLSIWYNDMGISIYNELQLCLRNVDLPCRGGQCSIQYFLRQGCYQRERDAVAELDKTYCERWQAIKHLCPNTRSWCDQ